MPALYTNIDRVLMPLTTTAGLNDTVPTDPNTIVQESPSAGLREEISVRIPQRTIHHHISLDEQIACT